jgi:steroid 5-alpha reductase family enzyme
MLTTAEVALIVAGIALLGTAVTVIQKRYADRRDAWWGRTQWALDHVLAVQGNDTERTVGLVMLTALQSSRLATDEERDMLEQVADALLPAAPDG